ncbi:MAG: TIGR02594 family protein, partial [Anaerolineales bacterium]|nr:TIGR02594 family protein [Anaerolineales bacterium]
PGAKHNPRILEYLNSTDLAQKYPYLPDETDWCAAFVNWCIEKVKIPAMNSALVHPWRSWGKASPLPPKRGAVTTFLWDDGWAHVSFYLGEIGNYVVCLGGNQSDAAWISVYHKKYVTSYRVY